MEKMSIKESNKIIDDIPIRPLRDLWRRKEGRLFMRYGHNYELEEETNAETKELMCDVQNCAKQMKNELLEWLESDLFFVYLCSCPSNVFPRHDCHKISCLWRSQNNKLVNIINKWVVLK